MNEAQAAIAIGSLKDVPYAYRLELFSYYGSFSKMLQASADSKLPDTKVGEILAKIRKDVNLSSAERELKRLSRFDARAIPLSSPEYPALLKEVSDAPMVLFAQGHLPKDPQFQLAFVGPRRPSAYGSRVARWLAKDLAREGIALVSGLARGVDSIAHQACVDAKTPTVAVLGCGLDQTYPREHALLRNQILERGAVLTEYLVGAPPLASHFPRRNRIVSGMCKGVLLVEGAERSGGKLTVDHALAQNRDVYAIPGPIDASLSFWPNQFISQGAKSVLTSQDILEDFVPVRQAPKGRAVQALPIPSDLSKDARDLVLEMDPKTSVSPNDLAKARGIEMGEVLKNLTELEMKGLVIRQSDATYLRLT